MAEGWVPRGSPSDEEAREAFVIHGSTLRLRNDSNWLFGSLGVWALLGITVILELVSHQEFTGSQSALYFLGFAAASLALQRLIVLPCVLISSEIVTVVNPVHSWRFWVGDVTQIQSGFYGWPRVQLATGCSLYLFGLQESLSQQLTGGSAQRDILEQDAQRARDARSNDTGTGGVAAAPSGETGRPRVIKTLGGRERSFIVLVVAWAGAGVLVAILHL